MQTTESYSIARRRPITARVLATFLGTVLACAFALSAQAAVVVSGDPAPSSFNIEARARNGNSGFEGVLFTPGNPSPAGLTLNPVGAPAWVYGLVYNFEFLYTAATGTSKWSLDFNRDGDYLDSSESVTSLSPTLAGQGFKYVNLFAQGNTVVTATVTDFTLNGTGFGPFTSALTGVAFNQLYTETSGQFGDITATGGLSFSGNGGQERPRVWVQLGSASPLAAEVPEPSSVIAWSLLGLTISGAGWWRRRKASA